jgi:hypothetical protein
LHRGRRSGEATAGAATRLAGALLAAAVLGAWSGAAESKLLLTREDALKQIYGERAVFAPRTAYLTDAQVRSVRETARAPFTAKRVTYYRAIAGDSLLGFAFLDQGMVRTMSETVLIALDRAGAVRAVEVLAWNEPDDFRPPGRWLDKARGLSDPARARPDEGMPHLAGATLTSRAVTAAVRRALALRRVLEP